MKFKPIKEYDERKEKNYPSGTKLTRNGARSSERKKDGDVTTNRGI